MQGKTIIIPVGLPGSGKSSWIRAHRKKITASSVVISGDQLRLMLHMGDYHFSHHDTRYIIDSMYGMTVMMLKKYDVIFLDEYYVADTLFNRAYLKSRLGRYAETITFVAMPKDLGACIYRRCTDTRELDTSRWPGVLLKMVKAFEPIGWEKRTS